MSLNVRDNGFRQDTFAVTVHVNGKSFGYWDKKTGGDVDSDEVKYYPGAMADPLSLGGRVDPQNLTLSRLYGTEDHDSIQILFNLAGKGKAIVTQRPLDLDGNPYGKTITWNGKLKRVSSPDVDSTGTDASMIEIEVSVSNPPSTV